MTPTHKVGVFFELNQAILGAMGKIKINGNDIDMTEQSQDQISEKAVDKEASYPEFKVDADLLKTPEAPKARVINNLA